MIDSTTNPIKIRLMSIRTAQGLWAPTLLVQCLAMFLEPIVMADAPLARALPKAKFSLDWQRLPDLPDELGVAGPFVGVHNDALIVAGGANFPRPVWETTKVWHAAIHVLTKSETGCVWKSGGKLPRPIGYGAAVSTPEGVVCIGGNDAAGHFCEVLLLRWDPRTETIAIRDYPPLPQPFAYGQAALIGNVIYLTGGQSGLALETATNAVWTLDLAVQNDSERFVWRSLPTPPWPSRAFHVAACQHNGAEECLYVLSGRRQGTEGIEFLTDVWEFAPSSGAWRQRADLPRCVAAGTCIGYGNGQLLVLGGDDGALFQRTNELQDRHPGFPRSVYAFDARTNAWSDLGESPQNQVTTLPVHWGERSIIATGEIRPRVRTPAVWSVGIVPP
jgi:N-acetylneuraminic acid mutarotase